MPGLPPHLESPTLQSEDEGGNKDPSSDKKPCFGVRSEGLLYVVATPIGNLEDLSARATRILREADAIICEDTRVTSKLLVHLNISKELISLHQHSGDFVFKKIVERLRARCMLAYVTDAGTPGLADPGGKLVHAAVAAGIATVPIPGPSALTTSISIAGFNLQEFTFLGWPPHKKGRQTFFKQLAQSARPVIFYESTHRIIKTLTELSKLIPDHQLIVARELTKKFETIYRGTAASILTQLENTSTKGEFVVIVNIESK
ncbi:MAG: 16S rRNA (cytidine(1402)-2'-O)-methyltransferase [Patescibacteria group bacterium]